MKTCDICGDVAEISDGVVGAYLCASNKCFMAAWDLAFPTPESKEPA